MKYDSIGIAYVTLVESTQILTEMPALISLDKERFDSGNIRQLELERKNSKSIGKNHRSVPLSNKMIALFHTKGLGFHSVSFFQNVDRNTVIHKNASKLDAPDATGIYQNIQHMLNKGKTVYSDVVQSKGGRKLWTDMHKHVDFDKAYIEKDGNRTEVPDFSDQGGRNVFGETYVITPKKK